MYTDKTYLLLAVIIFIKTVKLVQGGQNKGLWRHVSSIKFDTQPYFIIQFRIILVHTFIYEVFLKKYILQIIGTCLFLCVLLKYYLLSDKDIFNISIINNV